MCLGHRAMAAGQPPPASTGMFVTPTLCGGAADAGEIRPDVDAFGLLYGIGNLCAGAGADSRYDARRMVGLLIAGLLRSPA